LSGNEPESKAPPLLTASRRWRLDGWVLVVAALPNGCAAAGTNQGTVWFADPSTEAPAAAVCVGSEITALAPLSPGDRSPTVLAATMDNQTFALEPHGPPRLFLDQGAWRVARHGRTLWLGSRGGGVTCLDPSAEPSWQRLTDPVWELATDGARLACTSLDGSVTLLDARTGELRWRRQLNHPVYGVRLLTDSLIAGTALGSLVKFSDDGDELRVAARPAVRIIRRAAAGLLVGTVNGEIELADAELRPIWSFRTGSWVKEAVWNGDRCYVASADHYVYFLDACGCALSRFETGYSALSLDLGAAYLFVGSADDHLYALKT